MADTATTISAALKEVWPYDRITSQFYNENSTLAELEKSSPKVRIGDKAVVTVELSLMGGFSVTDGSGGSLNAADQLHLEQAQYEITHQHMPIRVSEGAIVRTRDNASSVAQVLDLQMKGATGGLRKQLSRQAFSDGTAQIVACATTTTSSTVLLNVENGQSLLERGMLYPGLTVDIGSAANEVSVASDRLITAVSAPDAAAPSITISGATVSAATTDFVSIANARTGATSKEMNGLANLVAGSGTVGALSATTYPTWAANVDSTTTAITVDAWLALQRKSMQQTGKEPTWWVLPPKQLDRLYIQLQQQVRFTDDAPNAGSVRRVQWNGHTLNPEPDCPRSKVYGLCKEDIFIISDGDAKWQNNITGGKVLDWVPDTDFYAGKVSAHLQLALKRRNSHVAFTALTA